MFKTNHKNENLLMHIILLDIIKIVDGRFAKYERDVEERHTTIYHKSDNFTFWIITRDVCYSMVYYA